MTTQTASTYLHPAVMHHMGVNSMVGQFIGTLSVGDIVQVGKIPAGAIITGASLYLANGAGDCTLRLRNHSSGASSTTSAGLEIVTNTASGVVQIGGGAVFPGYRWTFGLSSTAALRYATVEIANLSAATTGTVAFVVNWTTQPPWSQE